MTRSSREAAPFPQRCASATAPPRARTAEELLHSKRACHVLLARGARPRRAAVVAARLIRAALREDLAGRVAHRASHTPPVAPPGEALADHACTQRRTN